MSNFLQLSVNLLVCRYYGVFQTLRTATNSILRQWKFFSPKSVFFALYFLLDAFSIDLEPKLMMREAVNDMCMPSLCFHEREFFLLSMVIISVWWDWVGDRNLLGDIKILPWKCRYRLGIKFNFYLQKSIARWEPSFSYEKQSF